MPVAVNFGDEFAIHEEAEQWTYETLVSGLTIVKLLDDSGNPIDVEVIVQNIAQIQHMTEDEAEKVIEMM